ncbi:F-box domain-containing protein [Xylaria digitata]|nr:F-box domain-containing protein [Xylaria digitata]
MSNPPLDPEMAVSRLSYRPRDLIGAMISVTYSPQPPRPMRASCASSLGLLDRLPLELISIVLSMLDMQSIARFASLSFQGNAFVQSHRTYRELVKFAPQTLWALGKVGLIGLHSAVQLHTALRTDRCVSCLEYGAFLFLPTCERCCWECLCYNPLLRAISPTQVKRYFGLDERDLEQLPDFYVIPGKYGISSKPAPEPRRLISVAAAKRLGLMVHGSVAGLTKILDITCRSARQLFTAWYLQGGPPMPQVEDLLFLPDRPDILTDKFFGMASVPFPSISKEGRIEDGLWCKGCEATFHRYDSLGLPQDVLAAMVPSNRHPEQVLLGFKRRARSKQAFLDHVEHCYGAQQLVPSLGRRKD